jgi:hypothetical protein
MEAVCAKAILLYPLTCMAHKCSKFLFFIDIFYLTTTILKYLLALAHIILQIFIL